MQQIGNKDNKIMRYLSLFMLGAILLLPKINIISVPGSNTGIRIDDILIAVFFVLFLLKNCSIRIENRYARRIMLFCILFILSSALSIIFGVLIGTVPSVLIAILALIRKVEYFIFFYVGFTFITHDGTKETAIKFLRVMFIVLAIIGFLQIFGIIGSFNMGEYDFTFGDRASATFNGAYEYAAYLVTMICFFMYDLVDKKGFGDLKTVNFALLMVACFLVLFTKSRISLIALIVIMLWLGFFKCSGTIKYLFCFVSFSVLLFLLLVPIENISILERFATLNFSEMFESIGYLWKNKNFDALLEQYNYNDAYAFSTSDPSFTIRFSKWFDCIDGFSRNVLFGYGLNSFPTLDGNWVKILCENGIVGFAIFLLLIGSIFKYVKKNKYVDKKWGFILKYSLVGLLIGAIFIDILESSKNMELFWFILGIVVADAEKKQKTNQIIVAQKTQVIEQSKRENLYE